MSILNLTLRLRRITQEWNATQWVAVVLAAAMWLSVTATGLAAGVFMLLFGFRGDFQKLRFHWRKPLVLSLAALAALFALGTLWSDATLPDMSKHVSGHLKLLFIPALTLALSRGRWPERVLLSALAGLLVLLALSTLHAVWPDAPFWPESAEIAGVPLRTYTLMNTGAALAAYGFSLFALQLRSAKRELAAGLAGIAVLLVLHVVFIAPSRTGILMLLALAALGCVQAFRWRGVVAAVVAVAVAAPLLYFASPKVRQKFDAIETEIAFSERTGLPTSSGIRMFLWRKGLGYVAENPLIGGGTGAIAQLYRENSAGTERVDDIGPRDPHNQVLAFAIPFGLLGVAVLLWLWWALASAFWAAGPWAAIGQAALVEMLVMSAFNSPIQIFGVGWFFCVVLGTLLAAVWRDECRGGEAGAAVQSRP
ncbi:O-antigen ligase family protein [Tepidamorphus sp. 3E244]|uniref:O-antigen ligase family protein n=1 Tax=Tepidamorphus sp. 3E244 TaxID=3385498 RepID=UPI0038FD2587